MWCPPILYSNWLLAWRRSQWVTYQCASKLAKHIDFWAMSEEFAKHERETEFKKDYNVCYTCSLKTELQPRHQVTKKALLLPSFQPLQQISCTATTAPVPHSRTHRCHVQHACTALVGRKTAWRHWDCQALQIKCWFEHGKSIST